MATDLGCMPPADQVPLLLTWADIETSLVCIAGVCEQAGAPQAIVAVTRGGFVPAALLAHLLAVRDVRAVDVTHTVDDAVCAAKTARPVTRNTTASLGDLSGLDVLVVDDIAGSGDTLEAVVGLVGQAGAARVRTAVLAVNEANWTRPTPPHEVLTCVGRATSRWVVFPWEAVDRAPAAARETHQTENQPRRTS